MDLSTDPDIKMKILSQTIFKPTVWKYYIDDIFPCGTKIQWKNYPIIILDANTHFKQKETSSHISPFVNHQVTSNMWYMKVQLLDKDY